MSFFYTYNMTNINTIYQISSLIFNLLYNYKSNNSNNSNRSNSFSIPLSVPFSISIPYNSNKKEEVQQKDLDYFQMERLLKWMSLFFEDDLNKTNEETKEEIKEDTKEETKKAYKKELYNIYIGIRSDYKQYLNRKNYNNSLWLLSSIRSKNTNDLSKKIISDIELFNEGLKMFSLFNKI